MIKYSYSGLRKIISGGQSGADQAGLYAAEFYNVETGGFAPKGYRTVHGNFLKLKEFGLIETASGDYPQRTSSNVQHSDATVRLASNFNSPGEILTATLCKSFKKPVFDILLDGKHYRKKAQQLSEFIKENFVQVLNVAGNADRKTQFGNTYHEAYDVLTHCFNLLKDQDLLIHK